MSQNRKYTFDGHPIYLFGERGSGIKGQNIQDFYALRQDCLDRKILFEDPEFPALDKSLFHSHKPDRDYVWLRPSEIAVNPHFYVEGYSRFDVEQGNLKDCWLLAAITNLTLNPKLFYQVVCDDNSLEENYAGIFHFRFWRYGKWVDVVIDDRLPTFNKRLVFLQSPEKNEFWTALLEKAYAKLYGSYEALNAGNACEAFEDFSGGISETYNLKKAPENLFYQLENAYKKNSMLSCAIDAEQNEACQHTMSNGLVRGHAYAITKVKMIDINMRRKSGMLPMVRLRNPWGTCEWNGTWSDEKPEWKYIPDYEKEEIGLNFDHDGEFWMSFADFVENFDRLDVCHLSPNTLIATEFDRKWKLNAYEGEWIAGLSAGGSLLNPNTFHKNPQYVMRLEHQDANDVKDGCSVIVSLMQKNRRGRNVKNIKFLQIGFAIYPISESHLMQKPLKRDFFATSDCVSDVTFINLRTISCRFTLSPGHYLVVPSTLDPNVEGEFMIRIYSESNHLFEENDGDVGIIEVDRKISHVNHSTPEKLTIETLFLEVSGEDQEIDWMELKQLLDFICDKDASNENGHESKGHQNGFSKEICQSIVIMMDTDDRSGKLGLNEFKHFLEEFAKWRAVFRLYDRDNNNKLDSYELRDAFESAGYRLNNQIINSLLYRYGSSDKAIAFADFLMCAVKIKTMFEHFKEKDTGNKNQATFTINEYILNALYS